MTANAGSQDPREARAGLGFALSAYVFWGFLPIYYKLVDHIAADQVVAQRILWSVVFAGLYLTVAGRMREVVAILRTPAHGLRLLLSACFITVNWLVFIWAIGEHRVLEVSFGYFINPLVNVALGMVLLGERLTRWQAAAVAVAVAGVALQAAELGGIPWVSLGVAFSFGFYGYVRKTVPVGASPGLMVEVLLLAPFALAYLAYAGQGGEPVTGHSTAVWLWLAGSGIVTAGPLILFAAGARRLPMKTLGVLQYVAPSIQFLLAVLIYGEPLEPLRLASFALIWLSLALYSLGSYRQRATPTV